METEHDEPPENIASFNCRSSITGLVSFEMMSIKMMFTQTLTDHNNYLPLWAMGEERDGHQVHKSSSTEAVVEGSSQGVQPPAGKRLVKTTHCLTLKATACFQGVRLLPQPRKNHRF